VKIVLDCANGAASELAPRVFKKLGAEIKVMGASPDGTNINVGCGALETGPMRAETAAWGAWCGVSFDGDADRCMLSDEKGRLLDGDDIISIAAPHLKSGGRLKNSRVVLTLMSNCGLIKHLHSMGIGVTQVAVGDKNVTEAIEKEDLSLGGESSGHTIFREFAPTGDGLLTALQVISAAREDGRPMSAHASWKRFPQEVRSLKVESKPALEKIRGFQEMIEEWERRMGGEGRIFVRYSGTEPLLRVLVEGESDGLVKEIADGIIDFYGRNSGRASAGGAQGGASGRHTVEGK
jgi:phosphoglucosamine mutase